MQQSRVLWIFNRMLRLATRFFSYVFFNQFGLGLNGNVWGVMRQIQKKGSGRTRSGRVQLGRTRSGRVRLGRS